MLDMRMAQLVHKKRIEEEIELRNTLIEERGRQAAIEYLQKRQARREEIVSWALFGVLVVILTIGHIVI